MSTFLWVIVPYVCLAVFVVGHVWRYRYDKFGWTTRSSQLYEDKLLRIGSPLFHFGMLGVILGHVMGLLVPQSVTDAVGLSHDAYHVIALVGGIPAGVAAVVGLAILVYRRRTTGPVFSATTVNDKVMYLVLGTVIFLGIWNTIAGSLFQFGGEYNYREGVSHLVPEHLLPPAAARADGGGAAGLPAARAARVHPVRDVAVHPARPRLLRPPRLPHPPLPRLPLEGRAPGRGSGNRAPQRGWDKPELTKK